MDDIATHPSNGHGSKTWPERTCGKCRQKFTPQTARERRCQSCTAEARDKPKRPRGRPPSPGKLPRKLKLAPTAPTPMAVPAPTNGTPKPLSATTTSGVLKPSQIATAAELLELAGYTVQAVRTPAGEFLRVL